MNSYVIHRFALFLIIFILKLALLEGTVFARESIANNVKIMTVSSPSNLATSIFMIFLVILLAWLLWNLRHRSKKRKPFTTETRRQVLKNQRFRCGICRTNAGIWDYDHRDGNRANNSKSNCLVLCPTCHAKKSRHLIKYEAQSRGKNVSITIGLGLIAILIFLTIL
jgi:hypothetical protein